MSAVDATRVAILAVLTFGAPYVTYVAYLLATHGAAWETFDPRDGAPVRVFRTRAAARAYVALASRRPGVWLDYAPRGAGWTS